MSKGHGRIQRQLLTIFEQADHPAFGTAELCRLVYNTPQIQKKHRVAVIRALRGLSRAALPNLWSWKPEFERADTVWFDHMRIPLNGSNRHPVHRG